jgi:glutamate N-acetyltransferase/amino-acid N-acetyltransferase
MENYTCSGFKAAGIASGIKKRGGLDLGLIVSEKNASVAGVFTKNLVKAAPVILDMERTKSGICRAIIVNSGNANCCNGDEGLANARKMAFCAAKELGISEEMVLVASTGVIGQPLPIEKIEESVPLLVKGLSPKGFMDFSKAIMTTDTVPKLVVKKGNLNGKSFTIAGTAKGAGMIHPDMATLLCFICTDAQIEHGLLKQMLVTATDRSFNRITIDGDTSTNDTALIMANGDSGTAIKSAEEKTCFQELLDEVTLELAKLLIKDGEGVTKLVEVIVKGAASNREAADIARTVANSNLVKTAFFGEDANWGRIMGAVGRANVPVYPEKIDIYFDDVMMVKNGRGLGKDVEAKTTEVLKKPEFKVIVNLNSGDKEASIFTCDFSVDYVRINADYRS